jgi:hypothetical protein
MKKLLLYASLLFLSVTAFAQSTVPGPIEFVAHDPYDFETVAIRDVGVIDSYVQANSYGRNSVSLDLPLQTDCVNFSSLNVYTYPNRVDYSFDCAPIWGTWDPYVTTHETMHAFGVGEGSATNAVTGYYDPYGDIYSVMSRQGASGHLPAPYKEHIGWLTGNYSCQQVDESQTVYVSDIEAQTTGVKGVRILASQYILYRSDGTVYQNPKDYFYLEMRHNHTFTVLGGKRKGHSSGTVYVQAPGVQFRICRPTGYIGAPSGFDHVQSYLRLDVGSNGGLSLGQSYSFLQDTSKQITYYGDITHTYRRVTVTVISLDVNGATLNIVVQ